MFCGAAITNPSTQTANATIASAHLFLIHENGCSCVSTTHVTWSTRVFFCHRNHATITLPLENDCSQFARNSEKDIARCCVKTCHVLRWCSDTDAHLRKGFSTKHAQELSLQRGPCQNAPSPVKSLLAAPSCAGWTFHGRMKCHVISHQVQTCFSTWCSALRQIAVTVTHLSNPTRKRLLAVMSRTCAQRNFCTVDSECNNGHIRVKLCGTMPWRATLTPPTQRNQGRAQTGTL